MRRGEVIHGTKTALVTGACSGIGRAIAEELASLGYNLIIVSENSNRLMVAAEELRGAYPNQTFTPQTIDLARMEAADELYSWVKSGGYEINVLINNAGMFSFLDFLKTPHERIRRMLLLHDMTSTMLCRLIGEDMMRRGTGHILNMSSYSLWMPFPGLALYSASKAYVRSFSMAFAKEVCDKGIKVTALCPAGVTTDLYGLSESLKKIGLRTGILISPKKCARRGLKALWRGRKSSVPGWWNRLGIPFLLYMPMWLVRIARNFTMCFQK